MKLLLCTKCGDIIALRSKPRACECGQSQGWYKDDGLHAEFMGPARILGMANMTRHALMKVVLPPRPYDNSGTGHVWVINPDWKDSHVKEIPLHEDSNVTSSEGERSDEG